MGNRGRAFLRYIENNIDKMRESGVASWAIGALLISAREFMKTQDEWDEYCNRIGEKRTALILPHPPEEESARGAAEWICQQGYTWDDIKCRAKSRPIANDILRILSHNQEEFEYWTRELEKSPRGCVT